MIETIKLNPDIKLKSYAFSCETAKDVNETNTLITHLKSKNLNVEDSKKIIDKLKLIGPVDALRLTDIIDVSRQLPNQSNKEKGLINRLTHNIFLKKDLDKVDFLKLRTLVTNYKNSNLQGDALRIFLDKEKI